MKIRLSGIVDGPVRRKKGTVLLGNSQQLNKIMCIGLEAFVTVSVQPSQRGTLAATYHVT
jgi:hypothetical protein